MDPVSDMFLAKFTMDGTLEWVTGAEGQWVEPHAVGAQPDGGAVLVGAFHFDAIFGVGEAMESSVSAIGGTDAFIARYGPDGALQWVSHAGGSSVYGPLTAANDVAVRSDGSTVVVGQFPVTASFGSGDPTSTTLTAAGGMDMFVAMYDPDGALVWARREGGTAQDFLNAVALTEDEMAYATGVFTDAATFNMGDPNQVEITSFGSWDMALMRLGLSETD